MASETPCANCGKSVPDGAKLCPDCGAGVVPLPVLDGGKRAAGAGATEFRTGTRQGDVTLGIAWGVALPLILGVASVFAADGISRGQVFGTAVYLALWVFVLGATIATPIALANYIKRKYFVCGDAMQKTLWGWLILFVVSILGLLAVCFSGAVKI